MAASIADSLDCTICNENLLDPRPLPCGHSYCGPPRLCLFALENEDGGLRCAVCRINHNLRAGEIKPLYGIRDYIQQSSKVAPDDFSRLPCTAHPNKDFTLWCSNCNIMVCDDCIEELHDDHSIRNLRKFLLSKFERKLGKPFHEGIAEYRKCLAEIIESTLSELDHSKLEVQSKEKKLQSLLREKKLFDQYCGTSKENSANLPAKETNLLIKMLQTGHVNKKLLNNTDKCERISFEQGMISEYVDQTVDITIQSSVDTASSAVASSNETACSRDFCTIAEEDKGVETVSHQPPKTDVQASSTTMTSRTSDSNFTTVNKTVDRTVVEVCSCGYKHKSNAPWSSPVFIFLLLHVIERKPLRIGPSSDVVFCPFQFVVETELVSGNFRNTFLRIIVKCSHIFGKSLPLTTLGYKLWLRNLESRDRDKTKEGTWSNLKSNNLKFDAIRYSELLNSPEKWIRTERGDDCLEVGLKLMRLS